MNPFSLSGWVAVIVKAAMNDVARNDTSTGNSKNAYMVLGISTSLSIDSFKKKAKRRSTPGRITSAPIATPLFRLIRAYSDA